MTLTVKMISFFMLVVIIGAVGFGIVVYNVKIAGTLVSKADHEDIPRLIQTTDIARNAENEFASLRGFLVSGDDVSLNNFRRVAAENVKLEQELQAISRTEQEKKIAGELLMLDGKYVEIAEKIIIPLKKAGRDQEAQRVMNGELTDLGRQLRQKAKEYTDLRRGQISEAMSKAATATKGSEKAAITAGMLCALIGIGIGVIAARSIARPVNQMAVMAKAVAGGDLSRRVTVDRQDEIGELSTAFNTMIGQLKVLIGHINTNAEQLAASSEELTASSEQSAQAANQIALSITGVAAGADEQLAAADETAATVEQMSAGIQQIAANTGQVAAQSAQAADKAQEGGKALDKAVKQMSNIESTVNNLARVVGKLGDKSQEIGEIVGTIAGIAGQTNLLALNAAIEAARAGEQGRGFAVVAEEVRKLAEQSQEAAKKIAELIGEIQEDTNIAVVAMDDGTREVKIGTEVVNAAGVAFRDITELVDQVSAQVTEISAATQQMATGSQQIVGAVKKIDDLSKMSASESQSVSAATEEQLASMEEIAGSSEALAKLAQDLRAATAKFRV